MATSTFSSLSWLVLNRTEIAIECTWHGRTLHRRNRLQVADHEFDRLLYAKNSPFDFAVYSAIVKPW
jgi:hypothetical protein